MHFALKYDAMLATVLMIFLKINETLSFSTAHSASWSAQNWLHLDMRWWSQDTQ